MKCAHGYLFKSKAGACWRFRLFLPGGGHDDQGTFATRFMAKLAAESAARGCGMTSYSIEWKPTKSVPHPEEESP